MAQTQTSMKKLLKPLPLRERVYASLRKELFQGNFSSGQRITEQEIAESLGVSRTPVREALNLFRKQGILEQSHGGAYVFSSPSIQQVEDVFEIRRALEPLAARKVVKNCTEADIQKLKYLIAKERELLDEEDSSQTYLFNAEFRKTFFHYCGNERLANSIDEFMGHMLFLGILTLKKKNVRQIVIDGQTTIVEGLKKGDEEKMEKIILNYLDASYEAIMAEIK
ncbi:MAG: DNA-binding GntR family transcriptional regulator [Planctomycetota bacterium]